MNILLDTHILLWTLTRDTKLPQQAIDLIADENNMLPLKRQATSRRRLMPS